MTPTEYVAVASAAVSLLAAGITLYLGRKSQLLQVALKRIEEELRAKRERKDRASNFFRNLQRYRLELYRIQAASKVSPRLKNAWPIESSIETLQIAYDSLLDAFSDIRSDLNQEAQHDLLCGFHDDRQTYATLTIHLRKLLTETDESEKSQHWEAVIEVIPNSLQLLNALDEIVRGALGLG